MDQRLEEKCELFLRNRETIRSTFKWESGGMYSAAAAILTDRGREIDAETLRACDRILKEYAGVFSELRSSMRMPVLCRMALAPDPETYIQEVAETQKAVNMGLFFTSEYQLLSVMTALDRVGQARTVECMEQVRALLKRMEKNHPLLTSDDDAPFATLLVLSGRDTEELLAEAEECYALIKPWLRDGDGAQGLSHALVLYPEMSVPEKCEKVRAVYEALKEAKHRFGGGNRLVALAAASMLDLPAKTVAAQIIEADDWLKERKIGDTELRRLFAATLVSYAHPGGNPIGEQAMLAGTVTASAAFAACMMICAGII